MIKYIDMLREIYLYEMRKNISEEEKTVLYIPELKMYQAKEASNEEIRVMYNEIMQEQELQTEERKEEEQGIERYSEKPGNDAAEGGNDIMEIPPEPEEKQVRMLRTLNLKDSKIIVEKRLGTMTDATSYSHRNIKYAIESYLRLKTAKAIGYIFDGNTYYIMSKEKDAVYSLQEESTGNEEEFFHNYYAALIINTVLEREKAQLQAEKEEEERKAREEELRINPIYRKNFGKIVRKDAKKMICKEDFSAFDFRGIDLSNMAFLDCIFDHANFTDLIIGNTVFIRCSCIGIVEDGTRYDNVEMIQCVREKIEKEA